MTTPDQPTATATPRTFNRIQYKGVAYIEDAYRIAHEAALAEAKAEVARLKESYLKSQSLAAAMLGKSSDELTALRARVAELEKLYAEERAQNPTLVHRLIEDERDQLRARVAELEQDKTRLDWLEAHHNWLLCAETESPTFSCGSNENFQNWALKVATVRAAIDAAKGQP